MRHFLFLVVAGLLASAGCGDDNRPPGDAGDSGPGDASDAGDAGDSSVPGACTPPAHDPVTITECATLTPPATGTCTTTPGSGALLISGDILTPGEVLRGGQVLVDDSGGIVCVDCDCSGAAAAAGATQIVCPEAVVSPGLINTHDHHGWLGGTPFDATDERWEHRNEWRTGAGMHTEIDRPQGSGDVEWGELRQVMSGTTSINASGSSDGFLRNLDRASGEEGLGQPAVDYSTFPLGDTDGTILVGSCDYGSRDEAADIAGDDAYTPHVSEGINAGARNEFLCMRDGADDLVQDNSAFIHGIGVLPQDIGEMSADGTMLIWSPRTNIALYGDTARVTEYDNLGVPIALGTDWVLTGSMNMLRELRCADELNSLYMNEHFSDEQLWKMATQHAAEAMAMDDAIGILATGRVADISIFATRGTRADHRAVIEAEPQDIVLVLRGGVPLYGDADVVATLEAGCDAIDVCGTPKQACVMREIGMSLDGFQSANATTYPLFFCGGEPMNEPSCVPFRNGMGSFPSPEVDGSNSYTGDLTMSDGDGDGIEDTADNCPCIFNPIRPLDEGAQADFDGDGTGDACDPCPLDMGLSGCEPPDPNDRDRDGRPNAMDNCPDDPNPGQEDGDMDGKGDVCDPCPDDPNPGAAACPSNVYDVHTGAIPIGTPVSMSGLVVTGIASNGFYAQQAEGTTDFTGVDNSGIFVYTRDAPTVARGDVIDIVSGTVGEFGGALQLTSPTITVTASGMEPAPLVVPPGDVSTGGTRADALYGVLIRVEGVTVTNPNPDDPSDFNEYEVDGLRVDDQMYLTEPDPVMDDDFAAIIGPLGFSFSNSKLEPRDAADVIPGSLRLVPRDITVAPGGTVTLTALVPMAPTSDASVSLLTSPSDLLSGTLSITIPAGSNSGSATFTARATEGMGTVTATYNFEMATANVTIVDIAGALLITEYLEGASNDKALELTAGAPVDLSTCELRRFTNGATTYTAISMTGMLAAGESHVLCNSSISDASMCDEMSSQVNHNGDDAYELWCGGMLLDSFGQVGFDPGTAWEAGGVSTRDQDLRRKCTSGPDTDSSDIFDPSVDWTQFDLTPAPLPFGDLGTYTCP